MQIGIPKEIKNNERRVAITPNGVQLLVRDGHEVIIEQEAGTEAGFTNQLYEEAGASIVVSAQEVWAADMVIKVKEPQESEYGFFRDDLILFTYLHLANEPALTSALKASGITAIAYETMMDEKGGLPILTPMSIVAGRLAPQLGAHYLQSPQGGEGVLIGGVPGVQNGKVVIIGGGVAGQNALQIAKGLGAHVTILDVKLDVLQRIEDIYGQDVVTLMSNQLNIAKAVKEADVVIGAVLIPGSKAPKLVSEAMVSEMKPGSVIIDIAIDQGGIFETVDRTTSHDDPVYQKYGVLHYAVPNMPGAVPRTSTIALTNVTIPYAIKIARQGFLAACKLDQMIYTGVNIYQGHTTNENVAMAFEQQFTPLADLL
ncbi:alanine dehydrogenase [Amphibacillus marinus]|uniref:Alanine dehydrogenase n=1 Tax=Amphibacillus marinus TaxID=872970 RepID=A0A1H8M5B9_9BACI|nr:alanine dehydrogenase [Amphibacillus marinus]SEO12460.1 alanine dehydrogenase [Amphibacillus marinus]